MSQSRYPTPPSQADSITLSAYQQRTDTRTNQLKSSLPTNPSQPIHQQSSTPPSPPPQKSTPTVKAHYDLLNSWLHPSFQNRSPPNRANPRDKLTRLTRHQFQELSTDVYDELSRRIARGDTDQPLASSQTTADPFLASRDDFHPKRNQARQKLATLPRPRFKDLASDVFYELERRYPDLVQSEPSVPLNQNNNTPLPPNKLNSNSSRPPIPLPSNPSRPLNPPVNGGSVTTDLVVPDKSTLVIENNDDAYDDQISTDAKPIEPPTRSISIDQNEPRDLRKVPVDHRRSGSLSSLKYISHKQNSSDPHASTRRPSSGDRKNSNPSKVSINEYDRRVSIMQSKILLLEKELRETQSTSSRIKSSAARLEECEEKLIYWERLCEEQKKEIEDLQKKIQDEKKLKSNELKSAEQEVELLKREILDLNQRIESNQQSTMSRSNTNTNDSMVEKLKAQVVELVDELRQMQSRQDQLLAEQEIFQENIRDLEAAVSHHKKRYEAAKTELRSVKRTSTQYSPKEFLPNEKLPLSKNGAIVDIHFTMFTTSIDDLLRAGRSNMTNELISVMRAVIDSVGDIDDDVQQFEVNPSMSSRLSLEEQEMLDVLKARINATLSNLITACKNHVTSFGLSPISLLDAAASHLCFSLVELVQLVGMRKANEAEIEMYENFHSKRSKYDDDDPNGVVNTGFQPPPVINNISNKNAGSPRLWKDESPAPLKINKDRDNDFNRGDKSNEKSFVRNGTSNLNSNSNKLGHFLERNLIPASGGANSSATRPVRPLNSSEKNHEPQGISRTQQMANKFEELRSPSGFEYGSNASDIRDSASGSSSTNPDKVFDSPPRGGLATRNFPRSIPLRGDLSDSSASRPNQVSNFQSGISKSNDQDLEKLKVYLESQTEIIVGSIQSLLSTIRGTATNSNNHVATTKEMKNHLDQIIQVVSQIIEKCSTSNIHQDPNAINNSKLDLILDELNQNCQKLNQLNDLGLSQNNENNNINGIRQNGFSKQVKQAMAASCFGVAKALKELNAHISGTEESLL